MRNELRVDESEMARVVETVMMTVLPQPRATFAELREIVPDHVTLHRGDRERVPSRPNEDKWHRTLGNLKSHPEAHPQFIGILNGIRLLSTSGLEKRIATSRKHLPEAEAKLAAARKRGADRERIEKLAATVGYHRGVIEHGMEALPRLRAFWSKRTRRAARAKLSRAA